MLVTRTADYWIKFILLPSFCNYTMSIRLSSRWFLILLIWTFGIRHIQLEINWHSLNKPEKRIIIFSLVWSAALRSALKPNSPSFSKQERNNITHTHTHKYNQMIKNSGEPRITLSRVSGGKVAITKDCQRPSVPRFFWFAAAVVVIFEVLVSCVAFNLSAKGLSLVAAHNTIQVWGCNLFYNETHLNKEPGFIPTFLLAASAINTTKKNIIESGVCDQLIGKWIYSTRLPQ